MENRFHSPYKHWVRGLGVEVVVLSAFLLVVSLLGALVAWVR